jgi:hypothetical protein
MKNDIHLRSKLEKDLEVERLYLQSVYKIDYWNMQLREKLFEKMKFSRLKWNNSR